VTCPPKKSSNTGNYPGKWLHHKLNVNSGRFEES
jgi:hypothetical protein